MVAAEELWEVEGGGRSNGQSVWIAEWSIVEAVEYDAGDSGRLTHTARIKAQS